MKLLLPPSESKSDGGTGVLEPAALGFPSLRGRRRTVMAAARRLPLADAPAVLHLGPKTVHEARWNRALTTAPVRPAIERYTGVLYEAIDLPSLPEAARAWIEEHVVVASAMFGLLRPSDAIPRYRLSGSTVLPGLPLKAHWSAAVAAALARSGDWILDARSEAYVALGHAPAGSAFLWVESTDGNGTRRALNHFNKHAKGELVRALALAAPGIGSRDDLLAWAPAAGLRLEPRGEHDVVQVVAA